MDLKSRLEALRDENQQKIHHISDLDELNQVRVSLLGKKGPITEVLRGMRDLARKSGRRWASLPTKSRPNSKPTCKSAAPPWKRP